MITSSKTGTLKEDSKTTSGEGYLGNVTMKLYFQELEVLKPHEMFIERRVDEIVRSIVKCRCLMKPLLVDENTWTIIDGTHRLEALKRLNALRAPVLAVDYLREKEVKIERWIRVYRGRIEVLEELLKALRKYIPGEVTRRGDMIVYRVWEEYDPVKAYRSLNLVEGSVNGVTLEFKSRVTLRSSKVLILIPPRLSKIDVVRAALEGRPFPPKTTRHITLLKKVIFRSSLADLLSF